MELSLADLSSCTSDVGSQPDGRGSYTAGHASHQLPILVHLFTAHNAEDRIVCTSSSEYVSQQDFCHLQTQ